MNVDALTGLFNLLHSRNHTVSCPDELLGSVHHVDFVFKGRVTDETVSVLLAIKFEHFNKILLGAINGNLPDMAVVSSMYASGLGMPLDVEKALTWAAFSTLEPDTHITYAEAVLALKADRKHILESCLSDGMVIPEAVVNIAEKLATRFRTTPYSGQELKKGMQIVPLLPGVQVTLLYRALDSADGEFNTRLYGVLFPQQDKLVFNRRMHEHFDLPQSLGEIRGRNTIAEYTLFGKTVKLYCVQGTLTTPRSLVEARNAQFPEYTTVRALLEAVADGRVMKESAAIAYCKPSVKARLAAQVKKLSALLKELKAATKPRKAEIAEAERKLNRASARIEDESYIEAKAKDEAQPMLAKGYLQFVATEMFVCSRGVLKNAPLGKSTEVHLQSLGFRSFTHLALEMLLHSGAKRTVLSESELDNVIDKFNKVYRGQHRITSVLIRPNSDSVNIKTPYSYKRSKETAK